MICLKLGIYHKSELKDDSCKVHENGSRNVVLQMLRTLLSVLVFDRRVVEGVGNGKALRAACMWSARSCRATINSLTHFIHLQRTSSRRRVKNEEKQNAGSENRRSPE